MSLQQSGLRKFEIYYDCEVNVLTVGKKAFSNYIFQIKLFGNTSQQIVFQPNNKTFFHESRNILLLVCF